MSFHIIQRHITSAGSYMIRSIVLHLPNPSSPLRGKPKSGRLFNQTHLFSILAAILLDAFTTMILATPQSDEVRFQRISIEQGLSQSIVESIVQDRRGFIWFSTEDGLNRYDGYEFTVLRNNPDDPNSLSHNQNTVVYEDMEGKLWIGTFNGGLNQYDPKTEKFVRYRHDPQNPYSLSHDVVRALRQDRNGSIWVGTEKGLNRLAKTAGDSLSATRFQRFYHDPNDSGSLADDAVRVIYEERDGSLWIGTDGGLDRLVFTRGQDSNGYSSLKFVHYRHSKGDPNSLSDDRVRSIFQDKDGALWIGTANGLNKLIREGGEGYKTSGGQAFQKYFYNPRDTNSLSHNQVYAIFEDHKGAFWIGTNGGGLNNLDRKMGIFTRFINNPRDPRTLSYNEIRSIYEDRSGNLWVGTYGGGISKIDRARKAFQNYRPNPDNPNSLNEAIVWCIYEDKDGILWIGTHGGGLNRFDRRRNEYTHFRSDPSNPNSLSNDVVRLVIEDRSGAFWIGTDGGGVNKFDRATGKFTRYMHDPANPNSISHNEIRSLFEDKSGNIWIGTRGGGIDKIVEGGLGGSRTQFLHYCHDPKDPASLSNDYIRQIYQDKSGVLWVATYGGGLEKFEPESGKFTHFRANPHEANSLGNDYIFAIHEDREGILWLATWGGGLNRFDRKADTFSRYTLKDGLPSDAIYGILEDEGGNLWLSTVNGLSKFIRKSGTFRNFTETDGIQSKEFNGGSYFKSKRGEMFFGGINGFNAFFPEDIKDNLYVPPVVITSFRKLNELVKLDKPVPEIQELALSYKDYVFSFEFAALDYTAPEKNQYAYKMEGLDKDWIFTTAEKRFAHYTTLPPGEYIFKVKGSNNDGIWNEQGTAIRLTITPPFWKTPYFNLIVILAISTLVFVSYRRRLNNVRMKAELRAAHDAQMSIMPGKDPAVEGFDISGICIPANEVGGDFFDYLWVGEDQHRFGVVVGDVSGKAMKAAMTAVMSCGMIHSGARDSHPVGDILSRINGPLYLKTEKDVFIAACLAAINIHTKELTFTNAGLTKPLLKSQGSVTYLEAAGATHPLGMASQNSYLEKTVQLHPGDLLIFMTDGIPEAQNRTREFFGDERLKDLISQMNTADLSAREIKDAVIQAVKAFSGSAPQHDDMTVVAIKILPR